MTAPWIGGARCRVCIFFTALVHRDVAPLIRQHPAIEMELLTLDALVDIDGRQADIAIRAAAHPPKHLVGRRIASLAGALYASRDYFRNHDGPVESDEHTWVDWDRRLSSKPAFAWLQKRVPDGSR
jgi:DNA-binding transcriptional LysR family regulator